ncbi:AAA family ATPase [Rhodovibrio salinarum]|uniref:YhaN AAA domain-containing protein n=1 Tax=Rhodovibrio salinarum TaxID=1087 RepID=A0A934QL89_9PROT|nr:AAA family ATPase [Rhodovibrio salinarum]MBK1698779.1 hypothetical protein [Rhodovibrio salinarum]
MIIRGWQIDGFGAFRDQRSSELASGLSVLHGPNEAGKSTLLAFIRGVLFGFPDKRNKGVPLYEPPGGGAFGGSVFVEHDGRRYTIHRRAGSRNNAPTITDAGGQSVPEGELPQILGGADKTLFQNVFGFSLWELQEGQSLTAEGVRDRIFSGAVAGAGLNARRAAEELEARAKDLYSPNARQKKNQAAKLLDEIRQVDQELVEAKRAARDYPQKVEAERTAAAERKRLDGEIAHWQGKRRELDALLRLWEPWCQRARALETLERLTGRSLPRIDPVPVDDALDAQQRQVDALRESLGLQRQRLQDAGELAAQLEAQAQSLARTLQTLGPQWTEDRVAAFTLPIPARDEVHDWERALDAADAAVTKADEQLGEAERRRQESAERHAKLAQELEALADPPPALATLQRRQAELEDLRAKMDELARLRDAEGYAQAALEQADARVDDARDEQSGRGLVLGALAVAVLAAVAAGVAGVQGEPVAAGALAALALAAGAVSAWLHRRRRQAAARVQRAEADRDAKARDVDRQSERRRTLEQEADAAAQALDFAERPGPGELARAVTELGHRLEDRRRLDRQIQDAEVQRQEVETRQEEVDRRQQTLESARAENQRLEAAWAEWKRARAFPEASRPQGVLEFAEQLRQAQDILRETRSLEAKRQQLDIAIAGWEEAARGVLQARGADSAATGEALIEAFNACAQAIQSEQEAYQQVREVEAAVLREASNEPARAAELRETLAGGDAQAWADERERLDAYLAAQQEVRDDALRQEEEAARDRKAVETSDRIAELETRRNQLAGEVARLFRQWQVYAGAQALIEETLERFERERQPAVFARASDRLARFSHGRYTQIRQAEAGQDFRVIDREGRAVQPIDLSRGTREQLYLAVRLGLIEEFAQRGTSLPLVLDEVLVNFDPERMAAVAAELARFAEDHQVLLFTCHPEIAERVQANAPGAASIPMAELAASS